MLRSQPRDQIAEAIAATDWKYYERPMPEIYFSHVKKNPGLVIDIGINTGFYAFLATTASDNNRVLGFEPDPRVRSFLQENITLNQLTDRISVSPLALSDRQGHATLYLPDPGHGLVETSNSLDPAFQAYSDTLEVTVSPLDDFLFDAPWQGKRVSTIKIDVEGHEREVLDGACRTIAEWRPMIFVEVLTRADHAALSQMIAGHRYVDVPLRPDGGLSAQSEVAFDPTAWNHAFVPAELLEDFLVNCREP